ncbi:hypothetical protein LguiB_006496 [Lonicera macranthoides]
MERRFLRWDLSKLTTALSNNRARNISDSDYHSASEDDDGNIKERGSLER